MAASYAQNLVSAVNTVMTQATRGEWQSVSPTRECGIEQRSAIREDAPVGLVRQTFSRAMEAMRESGLRSKEASLLDARSALAAARQAGAVTISEGTKGGRTREIPLATASAARRVPK